MTAGGEPEQQMFHSSGAVRHDLTFAFGPFRLFPCRQLLMLGEHPVKLGGRAFELLRLLVERAGQLVTKDELIAAAWPDTFVHDSNLKVNMHSLRRSLGDTQKRPAYIATIAGRGYRFVSTVQIAAEDTVDDGTPAEPQLSLPHEMAGREGEITRILADLREKLHVSMVRAGGVSKRTAAVAIPPALKAGRFDGVCFVDLSAIDDPMQFPATLIAALGIGGSLSDALTAVVDHLRCRQMLIVLCRG
jgi:DNA-binding winged helix-turn-helix (wHTH) protein